MAKSKTIKITFFRTSGSTTGTKEVVVARPKLPKTQALRIRGIRRWEERSSELDRVVAGAAPVRS